MTTDIPLGMLWTGCGAISDNSLSIVFCGAHLRSAFVFQAVRAGSSDLTEGLKPRCGG